jgi:uncharacterized protein
MSDSSNAPSRENTRANRLIDSTSPYLLQHAHNPVDWYPWGPEALERAKREGKPIFLSIGYSACHWCHVMEREVFEKQDIANIMNQYFVNIKVDREERPDLDEIYMLATQITSGSGGWPMSVWLTPDLEPFYAGTYFPPTDGYGRPGFPRLELALAEMWEKDRPKLLAQAKRVAEGVRLHADEMAGATDGRINLQIWLGSAVEQFADRFDPANGGLGTAPKFPPSQALLLWLSLVARGQTVPLYPDNAVTVLREMTIKTLDSMARGGIYDQIGGGFARYSTDERWLVPHFEKMLYDNAQLAPVYAWASVELNRPDFARIARHTLDFWLREMTSPQGAFYSTLDADSEGHEGKYYVWTIDEVRQTLAHPDDSALIIKHFGMTEAGNFEGKNILFVACPVEELSGEYRTSAEDLQKRIDRLCVKLRTMRDGRVKPGLDDKILTGWNGLMISALAVAGRLLREPRYLEAAHRAMGFLLLKHMEGGKRLLRTSRAGKAHVPAFLEDHAYLLNGLMDLIDATSPLSLPGTMARRRALELADQMIKLFHDPVGQGFFFTHDGHEKLFARTKNGTDNATPSASAVAIRALLRLARVSGRTEYNDIALNAVKRFAGVITKQPSMFATILLALVEDAQTAASNPHLGMGHPPPGAPAAAPAVATGIRPSAGPLRLEAPPVTARVGESFEIGLVLHVAPGYHVQTQHPRGAETFVTAARIRTSLPFEVGQWVFPPAQQFGVAGEMAEGFGGAVAITAKCTLSRSAAVGKHVVRATVTAQPCSDASCLLPEQLTIEIPIEVLASSG